MRQDNASLYAAPHAPSPGAAPDAPSPDGVPSPGGVPGAVPHAAPDAPSPGVSPHAPSPGGVLGASPHVILSESGAAAEVEGSPRNGQPGNSPFRATFQTGRHYKVHKSYIWVAPVVAVVAMVVLVFLNGLQGWIQLFMAIQNGDMRVNPLFVVVIVLLGLVVIAGAFVGLYALAWRNMSYVFDEREFSYYSGIITKRRVHVPYARVQSVNHRASIIQRIVGVCTVSIDSAGGSSNKAVRVPYLQLETAERLRAELFMRKAAVEAGMEAQIVHVPAYDSTSLSPVGASSNSPAPAGRMRAAHQSNRDVPPLAAGELELAPTVSSGHARDAAPIPPGGWICSQCGKMSTGNFCADCGVPRPVAPAQPNLLDEAAGVVGDWRGLYGGVAAYAEESASYEFGLTNGELALTTISHDTPLAIATIIALTMIVTFAFVLLVQDEVAIALTALTVPLTIGVTVLTWAIGLVSVLLSYGNFRARRRGSRIEVERGLLARNFSGIDVERIQSIEIRQSFIRRLIGYCELTLGRIDTASEQNSGNSNSQANARGLVIHPFVKVDRVDEVLDGLVPELSDRPRRSELKPLPKPALRRAILRRCVWYNWMLWVAVAVAVCWGVLAALAASGQIEFASAASRAGYERFLVGSLAVVVVLFACITAARAVSAALWARHSGYAWNRGYLTVHNDGLSTQTSSVPRSKIQSAATRSNPFQRRLSLTALHAVTAAGTHSTMIRLLDIPAEDGAAYLDWVKPRR